MKLTHKNVSVVKSCVRLLACLLGSIAFKWFAIGFAVAELLGVVEEVADRRPE